MEAPASAPAQAPAPRRAQAPPPDADSLAVQLQHTLQWLYALTMTRLVAGQLELLRARLLNIVRFRALPVAGYTPEMIVHAIETEPDVRFATARGLLAPLLENWGLGMSIARIMQCFDVEGILWRPDAAQILAALLDEPAQAPTRKELNLNLDLDLASIRARITANLRTLEQSVRTASHVHPREVVIDAEPDDDDACNLLLPSTFPVTSSGSAGCRAAPSRSAAPEDTYPRPFYERAPIHPAIRWDSVFNHVFELKRNGPLVGDSGWDDAPAYSKKSKKSGQEKWDWKLMMALNKCVANFDDFEKVMLRSDLGGPTAKLLSLCDAAALLRIIVKLISALSAGPTSEPAQGPVSSSTPPSRPPFALSTVFAAYISQGPTRQFAEQEFAAQRSLFLQLYGSSTDFLPQLDSAPSSAGKKKQGERTAEEELAELLLMPSMRDAEQVSAEERHLLSRAAQESRDRARAQIGLPPLGLLVRNEVMRVVRESANAAFLSASASPSQPTADDKEARKRLLYALSGWTALASQLRREEEADRLGALLRAKANADELVLARREAVEDGWARGVSNALDVSTKDGWTPGSASLLAGARADVGGPGAKRAAEAVAAIDAALEGVAAASGVGGVGAVSAGVPTPPALLKLQETEAGLVGGVLLDPSLELNIAAALLKLDRGAADAEGVVRAATNALQLLAQQQPMQQSATSKNGSAPKPVNSGSAGSNHTLPLIDESTGPAEVLDSAAFWLGGGHRAVLQLDDFDTGFYGAGYAFASSRISRDVRKAEMRERRRRREEKKKESNPLQNHAEDGQDGSADEYEDDDDDEEESEFEWWEEEVDDEPAPGGAWSFPRASSARTGPAAAESEEKARERARLQRTRVREARAAVLARLSMLLGLQLGLVDAATASGMGDASVGGVVTPGLVGNVLAPGRSRTRAAWQALGWKALVRRGKGRVALLRAERQRERAGEMKADGKGEDSRGGGTDVPGKTPLAAATEADASTPDTATAVDGAEVGGKGQPLLPTEAETDAATQTDVLAAATSTTTLERSASAASPSTLLAELAELARKDFQAAISLDPADDEVPRRELGALEALLKEMRLLGVGDDADADGARATGASPATADTSATATAAAAT
ncbi:hypothetical protein OC844_002181 [Tilletia horrida]|nr:hypothetical protein OC844_002181 [Tilletia horrida]